MPLRLNQLEPLRKKLGFTLIETVISVAILAMVISGLVYGYVQANRVAEWSAMSLAAQSYASQGAEQARAADWRPRDPKPASGSSTGPGTMDELPPTNYTQIDFMDVPFKGQPTNTDFGFWETNNITITTVQANPPLRQIRSDCIWTYSVTGSKHTNTVILLRAPDQ